MIVPHFAGPVLNGPLEGQRRVERSPRFRVPERSAMELLMAEPPEVDTAVAAKYHEYEWDNELFGWRLVK